MKCYHCDGRTSVTIGGMPLCFRCAGGAIEPEQRELTQRGPERLPTLASSAWAQHATQIADAFNPASPSYWNYASAGFIVYKGV